MRLQSGKRAEWPDVGRWETLETVVCRAEGTDAGLQSVAEVESGPTYKALSAPSGFMLGVSCLPGPTEEQAGLLRLRAEAGHRGEPGKHGCLAIFLFQLRWVLLGF